MTSKHIPIIAILICISSISWACSDINIKILSKGQDFTNKSNQSLDTEIIKVEEGLVTKILDGITMEVKIDGEIKHITYLGLSLPSYEEDKITERSLLSQSMKFNKDLVYQKNITLRQDPVIADDGEPLQRYIYMDGKLLNKTFLESGFAMLTNGLPDYKLKSMFTQSESTAIVNGLGMWKLTKKEWSSDSIGPKRIQQRPVLNNPTNSSAGYTAGTLPSYKFKESITKCDYSENDLPRIKAKKNVLTSSYTYYLPTNSKYNKIFIDELSGDQWLCLEREAQEKGWLKFE